MSDAASFCDAYTATQRCHAEWRRRIHNCEVQPVKTTVQTVRALAKQKKAKESS